eukprot:scaffold3396_cov268-Ochromonas_danica.AAC.10
MLEPYEIKLFASSSETCLISLLQDLPHLNSLEATPADDNLYTDAILLTAIKAGFGKCLRELNVSSTDVSLADKALSEFLKACQLLDTLEINGCGSESLNAASKLPGLSVVSLNMDESVSKEMLDELLVGEKLKWSSTLSKGSIKLCDGWTYNYDGKSHMWINKCDEHTDG